MEVGRGILHSGRLLHGVLPIQEGNNTQGGSYIESYHEYSEEFDFYFFALEVYVLFSFYNLPLRKNWRRPKIDRPVCKVTHSSFYQKEYI